MLRKKQYIYLAGLFSILILLSIGISGCATTGKTTIGHKKFAYSALTIDKKRYIPLSNICANYDLALEWDGFSRVITVKNQKMDIRMFPGSSLILYNELVRDLSYCVRIHDWAVIVPEVFASLFIEKERAIPSPEKKKSVFAINKIIIDPGHGGKDPGAVANDLLEKDVNLDIAKRLKSALAKYNIEAVLTRDSDIFHELQKRSDIANESGADFFISIHSNASVSNQARGFEAYYLSANYDDFSRAVEMRENAAIKFEENSGSNYSSAINETLWDMILSENRVESLAMAKSVSGELKKFLKLKTRHCRGAMFHVLKGAHMPAVLLEVGYLTNSSEAAQLKNSYYRQMVAEAVASGIVSYKKDFELNNGFTR